MTVYLQLYNGFLREYNLIHNYCVDNNIKSETVYLKDVTRKNFTVGGKDIAHGTVEFISAVLKNNGKKVPTCDSYPIELKEYFHRHIWGSTLGSFNPNGNIFIKPKDVIKLFTGFIPKDIDDMYKTIGHSKHTKIYCSEVVKWLTEWRYYVLHGEIVALGNYDGDENLKPDYQIVKEAVKKIQNKPSAFCIDFGIIDNGKTALIEVNDGWSFGWYVDGQEDLYYELIKTRFLEMNRCNH